MGFVLSCATTPKRIEFLIHILKEIKFIRGHNFFVINVCTNYKRFGEFLNHYYSLLGVIKIFSLTS